MVHENWTMMRVTRCLEVASSPSFYPLAKSCRSRVCWVDMTSPLKQMAQFWSNYTPWIKLTVCTSKNWHWGDNPFFLIRRIFEGESCWLYEGYLDGVAAQQSSFEAPRNCSNDTKGTRRSRNGAFPATSLITRPCIPIGTTFFIAICMTRRLGNDKSSLSHRASWNGVFPQKKRHTVN